MLLLLMGRGETCWPALLTNLGGLEYVAESANRDQIMTIKSNQFSA
jgi:hypothetical protein